LAGEGRLIERELRTLSLRTPAFINTEECPRGALDLQAELQGDPLSKIPPPIKQIHSNYYWMAG